MAENINIDFMPNRNTPDIQRVTTVEDYLKLFTDRTKFCFASVYDDFADMGKRIEYLENYSLAMPSSVDLTVENAVILQEKESQQVIHNFTKTHYVKGNNVGYGGVGNSFVLGGYLVTTEYMMGDADYLYSEISFPKGTRINSSGVHGDTYDNLKFYSVIKGANENQLWYVDGFSSDGEQISEMETHHYVPNGCAFGYGLKLASVINPPDDTFAYGSADVQMYSSYDTATNYRTSYRFRLPFQSEAEYNAAIGLTNTPIELIELKDFQYLVPESQMIVDKALSPDSDNVIANSAVAKALEQKADKEAVENLSLVVDSKADIIEIEALAEIVNSKADSADVQSIAQAVESKAESSDLTLHTSNTANPHNVTKEQIGLSKVENKSSSEILSELQIGGTQILRNTQTTILGEVTIPALWSEGAWRKASGTNGTWESIDITDCPEPYIEKGWKITSNSATITISQNNIPLVVGKEYTLSCYVRGKGRLVMNGQSASGGGYTTSQFDIDSTEWVKYLHTYTAQVSSEQSVYIGVNYQGDSIDVCGMKLEIGNRVTAWNICPKDIADHEERIKALEATILSLGGET
ncbi:MAG: hypothetical protein E7490_05835 [Ruminococcaceae bacterium]|nr:hypothetical protein [Oscillospiraceae bacterium]